MDTALYVNRVGALVNDSTKYTIDIDEVSVENITLLEHLQKALLELPLKYSTFPEEFRNVWTMESIIEKLESYIHCMKKEMNFYSNKVVTEDCILTESDGHIRLEQATTLPYD